MEAGRQTTVRLNEQDRAAIATIRVRYGLESDSDAIRLALRILAESTRVDIRQEGGDKQQE